MEYNDERYLRGREHCFIASARVNMKRDVFLRIVSLVQLGKQCKIRIAIKDGSMIKRQHLGSFPDG